MRWQAASHIFCGKSLPDDQLFDLAAQGVLSNQSVLTSEVDRMLDDEKSQRFVEDFLDQWLELEDIDATTPDEKLYPEYDDVLRQAMLEETRRFFAELIWDDRGVRELIDSDFTFLNRRLAEHYGIPGIEGLGFRKVKLPSESPRGGLLTQASILKVTANGTNTSPVPRGRFVLANLLKTPPAPPPPRSRFRRTRYTGYDHNPPGTSRASKCRELQPLPQGDRPAGVCPGMF